MRQTTRHRALGRRGNDGQMWDNATAAALGGTDGIRREIARCPLIGPRTLNPIFRPVPLGTAAADLVP